MTEMQADSQVAGNSAPKGSWVKSVVRGWFYFTSVIGNCGCLVTLFLFVGIIVIVRSTGEVIRELGSLGETSSVAYELLVDVANTDDKVAIIPITGVIDEAQQEDIWGTGGGADPDSVGLLLDEAVADSSVAAIILEVDSPGGTVYASDIIFQKVSAAASEKPVVVFMKSMAASGGYYISLPAKHIVAHPETFTGSIGTIISAYNFSSLGEKIGVEQVVVKSGDSKDILNEWRPVKEGDLAILQSLVDESQQRFVQRVDAFRTIPAELRDTALDGRILSANQALEAGLIDEVGSLDDAIAAAQDLAGEKELDVIRYQHTTILDSLLGVLGDRVNPLQALLGEQASKTALNNKMLYLWSGSL